MTDLYGREIQISDICIFEDRGQLDSRPIWGFKDDCVEIADYHKELIKKAKNVVDITAIERETRKQHFINSVKALDVKPNDTVIASIVPEQITYDEAQSLFDSLKEIFPDNKVTVVMGLNISTEWKTNFMAF